MKKYVVVFIESTWFSLNIEDYADNNNVLTYDSKNQLITFQSSDLIREFDSNGIKSLPKIIDLESFDKQFSQEGKELRNFKKWKILKCLRHHNIIESDFRLSKDNIVKFMEHIASLYEYLSNKDSLELARFNNIETVINEIIYGSQLRGIRVNKELAVMKCKEIEKKIYKIKNTLQLEHNIFSPDDFSTQKDYLTKNNYNIIQSLFYSFKMRRKNDIICNLFYELLRNKQDLDSLLFISTNWGGSKRTYPLYLGFGSITSRIILRQPALQNLRKSNRDIIIPDDNMKLLYLDYSQFEAGILASLSNDDLMIQLYNDDIYADLGRYMFGENQDRKEAKILFYRFIYGDETLEDKVKNYFLRFENLKTFKKELEKGIEVNDKIGTENGNFRVVFDNKESNWILSHKIQSLASLIFKTAIIETHKKVKHAQFLIPMHDGAVYQLKESAYEESKQRIEDIFKNAFKEFCPKIEPKVNCKENFHEDSSILAFSPVCLN